MDYTDEWINLTGLYMDMAMSRTLTLDEAIRQLKSEAYLRTVWETVRRYSGLDDMDDDTLRATLRDMIMATNPEDNRDTVRKNISNWRKDNCYHIERESALKLAYALELTPRNAEEMLVRLCDEGFHWRDPRDIVLIYGLNNALKYSEVNALLRRLEDKGLVPVEEKEDEQKEPKQKGRRKKDAPQQDELTFVDAQAERAFVDEQVRKASASMTSLVARDVGLLQSEEELEQLLTEAGSRLGAMHNMAYTLFIEYMKLLKQPVLPEEDAAKPVKKEKKKKKKEAEEKEQAQKEKRIMSDEAVLQTYMFRKYVPKGDEKAAKTVMDALRKAIKEYWPESTKLSRMRTRQTDVDRKTMILLFLACDGGESAYGDRSDETVEDVFQDMYNRLDTMLIDCDFAPLDARSPFDWMVLYCMCPGDRVVINERMTRFLQSVFPSSEQDQEPGGDGN